MRGVLQWLNSPAGGMIAMWLLTQAAATMPAPTALSSVWWKWVYSLIQVLLANAEKSHIRLTVASPAENPPALPEGSPSSIPPELQEAFGKWVAANQDAARAERAAREARESARAAEALQGTQQYPPLARPLPPPPAGGSGVPKSNS